MPASKLKLEQSEAALQKQWLTMLQLNGILHWRQNLGGRMHARKDGTVGFGKNPMKGFPDTCGMTPKGKFWAAELKRRTGRLTDAQEDWILKLEKAGALVEVIYSLSDAITFLSTIKSS